MLPSELGSDSNFTLFPHFATIRTPTAFEWFGDAAKG
jgi:hypothetical protein